MAEEVRSQKNCLAGNIKNCHLKWSAITSDESILSVVEGLKLEFIDGRHPIQSTVPNSIKFSDEETVILSDKMDSMLQDSYCRSCRF